MPKKEDKNNILKNYQPVEGPTSRQLEIGLWWVEHRALLRRVSAGVLIAVNTLLWAYVIYGFGGYIMWGMAADEQMAQALIVTPAISHRAVAGRAAQDLVIGPVAVISSVGDSYDLAASVYNSNANWYATFTYYFSNNKQKVQPEFILPQEKKYLTSFLNAGQRAGGTDAVIADINWRRVDSSQFQAASLTARELNPISVADVKLTHGEGGAIPINAVAFTARNDSPYNFWEADFYLVAQAGSNVTGVNKYRVEKFYSGEKRSIGINWSGYLGGAQITIIPSVNVFDPDNYIPFELGTGQIK